MNTRIESLIETRGVLLSDGAMGTELFAMGLAAGECPESWNLTHPDEVRRVSASYREAGSDMVLTNTFGASRFKLAKFGLEDRLGEMVREGVRLAREGAGESGLVALSIGPTGEMVQPYGSVDPREMTEAFAGQVRAAAAEAPDAVCVESMFSLEEARLAVAAARESDACVIATMVFQKGPAGYRTIMGESPEDAVVALRDAGADVVGANCGLAIDDIIEIVKLMRVATELPILTHVNAGVPEFRDGVTRFPDTPLTMAAHAPALFEAGAHIIGGCCGTTPAHIRAIAMALAPFRRS